MFHLNPSRSLRVAAVGVVITTSVLAACSGGEDMTPVTATRTPTAAGTAKAGATTASTPAAKATTAASPAASPAAAAVRVRDAWARSTAGNPDENSAVYLVVENPGGADRLSGASISPPISRTVELHVTEMTNGQMAMRPVEGWDVPPTGMLELKPAGNHVMLIGLTRQLKVGDTISLTLKFQKAGEIKVDAPVRDAAAAAGGGMAMPK